MPDGYRLCLTYYLATRPQAVLVLYPAMGILQRYYRAASAIFRGSGSGRVWPICPPILSTD